jgi:hypothetical protein
MKYNNLKQELTLILNELNKYSGVGELLNVYSQEQINEYWEVVELCRDITKQIEYIYERYESK